MLGKDWAEKEYGKKLEIKEGEYSGAYLDGLYEPIYEGAPHYMTASGEGMKFISKLSF